MPTTAATIITAAIARSTANDSGTTEVASNTTELLGVLNRLVQKAYGLAALPEYDGGFATQPYFERTTTVTLGTPATLPVPLPSSPQYVYAPSITDTGGTVVRAVTLVDLREGRAEIPPAVIVTDGTIRSAGRTGDPTAGAVLTLDGAYVPAVMTSTTHFIGATTPTDGTTTAWPYWVGDQWLVDSLALYLAVKDGVRDDSEVAALTNDVGRSAAALAKTLRVSFADLASVKERPGAA